MKSFHKLSEHDLAELYLQAKGGVRLPGTAQALVDDVWACLRRSGLGHRVGDAVDIAVVAYELAQQAATPEQAAFEQNITEGTTADDQALQLADDLALAGQVRAMSLADFAAQRRRFGLAMSVSEFLQGLG